MKKYLEDLRTELKKKHVNEEEIDEILHDHEEMIDEALAEGLSEADIATKFGDPFQVAADIAAMNKGVETGAPAENRGSEGLWKSFAVSSDPLKCIIKLVEEDIEYEVGDTDQLLVYHFGTFDENRYTLSCDGGEFNLFRNHGMDFKWNPFHRDDTRFVVVFPAHAVISSLFHTSVSADFQFTGLTVKDIQINTTSGDAKVARMVAETLKLSTVSGDVSLSALSADSMNLSMVSGDMNLNNAIVEKELRVNTVSGDLKVSDVSAKDAIFSTVSGDLDATEFYPSTIRFSSVSGDITVKNSDASRRIEILSKKSVSGDIRIESGYNQFINKK